MRLRLSVVSALLASLAAACTPATSPDAPPIAAVHTRQCGKCHSPPAPRSHTRAELQEAFTRHRGRAHLTDEEWAQMVDYLASPGDAINPRRE
jgi:hypothetical protein